MTDIKYIKKSSLKNNKNRHSAEILVDDEERMIDSSVHTNIVSSDMNGEFPLLQNEGIKRRLLAAGIYKT